MTREEAQKQFEEMQQESDMQFRETSIRQIREELKDDPEQMDRRIKQIMRLTTHYTGPRQFKMQDIPDNLSDHLAPVYKMEEELGCSAKVSMNWVDEDIPGGRIHIGLTESTFPRLDEWYELELVTYRESDSSYPTMEHLWEGPTLAGAEEAIRAAYKSIQAGKGGWLKEEN